jgi:hypothetical protein
VADFSSLLVARRAIGLGFCAKTVERWKGESKMSKEVKIRGMGPKYVSLLEKAGVDRVGELIKYEQTPQDLVTRLEAANKRVQVVQRLPTKGMVLRWIGESSGKVSSGKATKNAAFAARHSRLAGPPTTPPPKVRKNREMKEEKKKKKEKE